MVGLNSPANWLVCYDISEPRRLARVFRLLKKHGIPIQYSVFLVAATPVEISQLEQQIAKLINPLADDVRAYRIAERQPLTAIGQPLLADGVLIGWGLNSL